MAATRKKRQPSTIDKLPAEVRLLIAELRQDHGATIDQILEKLRELQVDVSRSALGRHVKQLSEIGEEMRRQREIAKALVSRFGDEPENHLARLNLELMHGVIMRLVTAQAEGEDGEARPIMFGPEEVMFLSSALQRLSSAQKTDTDREMKVEEAAKKKAAAAAERVAKAQGISKDTIALIRNAVLGVE